MSAAFNIGDYLPAPPEGWKWDTSLHVDDDRVAIYVRLDPISYPTPQKPESSLDLYQFCDPTPEDVVATAERVVARFEAGILRADRLGLKRQQAEIDFASLLTGSVVVN